MAFGGGGVGGFFPSTLAWIADDCNSDTIIPLENVVVAAGQSGPPINRWGDYLTTRHHVPYGNTWAASAFALNLDLFGNIIVAPRYVWFGRRRDAPPANNTIRVDRGNASGWEDGSATHPYNTFTEGDFAALNADTVVIQAGNYPETGRFGRVGTAVTVRSQGGTVTIGQ